MIKLSHLTPIWDSKEHCHSGQSGPRSNDSKGLLRITQTSEVDSHH